jgi:hypothetical protein
MFRVEKLSGGRMKSSSTKLGLALVAVLLASSFLIAADVPLNNWTVPPYRQMGTEGGLTTMDDISFAHPFVAVAPCRLVDTRQAGFPAGYGTPALAAGVPRNFDLNSQPNCDAAPDTVAAYSLNFTVTNTQGPGFLKVYPQGGSVPVDISTINYVGGQTIANAAIVPAGTNGGITVIAGVSGTDVIIDINGYFAASSNDIGIPFQWETSNTGTFGAGIFENNSTSTGATLGLVARVHSSGANTAAVKGTSFDDTGSETWGVWGQNDSSGADSAGVYGTANLDDDPVTPFPILLYGPAGVRGVSGSNGVIGIGENAGVIGALEDEAGGLPTTQGRLGTNFGDDPGITPDPVWAVFGLGHIGASGTKYFLDPHPTDASKVIGYIALEGPEAGTYFRGRGKFERGMAKISIPEDFRLVTDAEGLTVQVTPIGAMATVGVLKIDLNEIVVQSSRNVEFSYLVQGVRATFKDTKPIFQAGVFRPESAESTMPRWLSEGQKRSLIANGTFREDGKVNMETAGRLGWEKIWVRNHVPAVQTPSD